MVCFEIFHVGKLESITGLLKSVKTGAGLSQQDFPINESSHEKLKKAETRLKCGHFKYILSVF